MDLIEKVSKELDEIDMPPELHNAFLVATNAIIIAEQIKANKQ